MNNWRHTGTERPTKQYVVMTPFSINYVSWMIYGPGYDSGHLCHHLFRSMSRTGVPKLRDYYSPGTLVKYRPSQLDPSPSFFRRDSCTVSLTPDFLLMSNWSIWEGLSLSYTFSGLRTSFVPRMVPDCHLPILPVLTLLLHTHSTNPHPTSSPFLKIKNK